MCERDFSTVENFVIFALKIHVGTTGVVVNRRRIPRDLRLLYYSF